MPIEGINLSQKLRTGFIPLDFNTARAVGSTAGESWANATAAVGTPGGGFLSSATAPRLTSLSTALRGMVLDCASGSAVQVQFSPVVLPPDFTSVSSASINVLAGRAAAASSDTTPAFLFNFWTGLGSSGTGLRVELAGLASSAPSTFSANLTTAQVQVAYPNTLAVTVNGVSSQDNLKLYGAWIEYVRAQRG